VLRPVRLGLVLCFPFGVFSVSLCFLQEWSGLISCTGGGYEAMKPVLRYKSAAAPPLMAGSIVADLWHQTVPGNAGRVTCGLTEICCWRRCWAVGLTGINAFVPFDSSVSPPYFWLHAARGRNMHTKTHTETYHVGILGDLGDQLGPGDVISGDLVEVGGRLALHCAQLRDGFLLCSTQTHRSREPV